MRKVITSATDTYRKYCVNSLWLFTHCFRTRVEGMENIPEEGPVLLVSNHESHLDGMIFGAYLYAHLKRHICFLAKQSLRRVPFIGRGLVSCGAVFVNTDGADIAAYRDMVEHLRRGDILCIFPEGTRSKDGAIHAFKEGAFRIAKTAKVAIVPVHLEGTGEAWPKRWPLPRLGSRIIIRIGKPIPWDTPNLEKAVYTAICELAAETARLAPTKGRTTLAAR